MCSKNGRFIRHLQSLARTLPKGAAGKVHISLVQICPLRQPHMYTETINMAHAAIRWCEAEVLRQCPTSQKAALRNKLGSPVECDQWVISADSDELIAPSDRVRAARIKPPLLKNYLLELPLAVKAVWMPWVMYKKHKRDDTRLNILQKVRYRHWLRDEVEGKLLLPFVAI